MERNSEFALDGEKLAEVRAIIVEELELDIEPEEVGEDADFVDDYDADSLSIIQIIARMERELRLPLPRDRLSEAVSLREISRLAAEAADTGPDRG